MAEVDYQTALLLQNKFDQEKRDSQLAKKLQKQFEQENLPGNGEQVSRSNLSDSLVAQSLHEQFQTELEVDRPNQNLVYDASNSRNSRQAGKSLTDPSWEVIDPTPDIHMLFIAFNERFFWNQLGSVTVSWSKRMTTCAGICSYQGRGGMCTITLSEPLLKLRPRKDLVETLLHEMIHAYLFVTNNNRDRDGHGPEFHRHMNRINNEAGTKITVYHNFHDEVNLYKTHWWRCNGPCQTRKPFFGLVRRAMNRAPGPNDFWWAEHSQTCGGQFIKVKEPEKSTAKESNPKSLKNANKSPDIRKFFPTNSLPKSNRDGDSNIKTVDSKNQSKAKINKVISNSGNIFGFGNLSGDNDNCDKNSISKHKVKKKISTSGETLGAKNPTNSIANVTNGVLSRKKLGSSDNVTKNDIANVPNSTPIKKSASSSKDYDVVRNHWINKFSNTSNSDEKSSNQNLPMKRRSESASSKTPKSPDPAKNSKTSSIKSKSLKEPSESPSRKISPLSEPTSDSNTNINKHIPLKRPSESPTVFASKIPKLSEPVAECPVCSKQVPEYKINNHLDECLGVSESGSRKCHKCGIVVAEGKLPDHLEDCNDDIVFLGTENSDKEFTTLDGSQEDHQNTCDNSTIRTRKCDICNKTVPIDNFDVHVSKCLHGMFDRMEEEINQSSPSIQLNKTNYTDMEASTSKTKTSTESKATVQCLACNKKILKSELDEHLENCMSLSQIFDDENEPVEQHAEEKDLFNCPSCMKLFSELEMNDHIDICLNISDV